MVKSLGDITEENNRKGMSFIKNKLKNKLKNEFKKIIIYFINGVVIYSYFFTFDYSRTLDVNSFLDFPDFRAVNQMSDLVLLLLPFVMFLILASIINTVAKSFYKSKALSSHLNITTNFTILVICLSFIINLFLYFGESLVK